MKLERGSNLPLFTSTFMLKCVEADKNGFLSPSQQVTLKMY